MFEHGANFRPERLDVSLRDGCCRVRRPKAMRLVGMFRRTSNSLFME